MTADVASAATNLQCGRCGRTTDECLSLRDDCCVGCTHDFRHANDDIDEMAVLRAIEGDVSVRLTRDEHASAWRELERRGLSAEQIGACLGTTGRTIQRWRDGDAHPTARPSGGRMTTPIAAAQNATDSLLLRARRSDAAKVRTAVRRVDEAFDRLRQAMADDDRNREARERIARLETELREAKAALRGKAAVTTATPIRRTGEPSECGKCGKVCANAAGRSAHERHCDGTAA